MSVLLWRVIDHSSLETVDYMYYRVLSQVQDYLPAYIMSVRSPTNRMNAASSDTVDHSVFSDYSHINVDDLHFAIGLRLNSANAQQLISKILPMSRTIHAEAKQKEFKHIQFDNEKNLCMKEDCIARRQAYKDLHAANEALKREVIELGEKLELSKEILYDKDILISKQEEKNMLIKKEIEELAAKKKIIDEQVYTFTQNNQHLRFQLGELKQEVEKQKSITQEVLDRLQEAIESKNGPTVTDVIQDSDENSRSLIQEIMKLTYNNQSDSDNDV